MKKINTKTNLITISNDELNLEILENGEIHRLYANNIQINQLDGNYLDGSLMNVYLKTDHETIQIIGGKYTNKFSYNAHQARWCGKTDSFAYEFIVSLQSDQTILWDIKLDGHSETVDVYFVHDLGLADFNALKSNEAYMSQYIDIKYQEDSISGVMARQNQSQAGKNPYYEIGTNHKIYSYATDGYDFYGKNFKVDREIQGLKKDKLPSRVFQYEMSLIALHFKIDSEENKVLLYSKFSEDMATVSKQLISEQVFLSYQKENLERPVDSFELNEKRAYSILNGLDLSNETLNDVYPKRKLEEFNNDVLQSFFLENEEHVILKQKEKEILRPHGHVLISNTALSIKHDVLTSTNYMNGIFQAQTVLGNTSNNKLISPVRNSLNTNLKNGSRIFVRYQGTWHLLNTPSAYELGFNYSKWLYKLSDDLIEVIVYTEPHRPRLKLLLQSQEQISYDFLITHDISMAKVENQVPYYIEEKDQSYYFTPSEASIIHEFVPELTYTIETDQKANSISLAEKIKLHDDIPSLFTIALNNKTSFEITYSGKSDKVISDKQDLSFAESKASFIKHYETLLMNLKIEDNQVMHTNKINTILRWYTHDMLVHYLVPHGLEQFEGAAWGTRDVCQGPSEYFLATNNLPVVREIIETVYSHQFEEDGNWPQWFMFDEYTEQMAPESHGDIIVWPLKLLATYLDYSDDFDILNVELPFINQDKNDFTKEKYSLKTHLIKQLNYIKDNFIEGTHLSRYADGDWDDTLQPHNDALRENMASTWTVALTHQSMKLMSETLKTHDDELACELETLTRAIKEDYKKYFLSNNVLPGFIHFNNKEVDYIIHPEDKRTGIDYRLIPMTRSMIAGLFTPEQLKTHLDIIERNLKYPDGVRLMSKPANYAGGVSEIFERAEQAANFGREIGLQYVHAHLRYIEAMTYIGEPDKAWEGLLTVNPILITDQVENANMRQSNAYFSSSDGEFINRYEAKQDYRLLKTGEKQVNGGWRVYSSGPGIYIGQVISNLFGLRIKTNNVVFDPILPNEDLSINLNLIGKDVKINYLKGHEVQRVIVNGQTMAHKKCRNEYREGGIYVDKQELKNMLKDDGNEIIIERR